MSQRTTSIMVENRHDGSAHFGDAKGIKSEIPLIYIKFYFSCYILSFISILVDFYYFM